MPVSKKQKTETQLPEFSSNYYPKEISHKTVAEKYLKDENKPVNILNSLRRKPDTSIQSKGVVHLFNNDLRIRDNKALHHASKLSQKLKVPLIGLYIYCVEELYSHAVGKFQVKFKIDTLKVLQKDLQKLNIPLVVLTVEQRKDYFSELKTFLQQFDYKYVFGNINYEVDELRQFIKFHKSTEFEFQSFHDTCVVPPGELVSGKGTAYSVFKPWSNAWNTYVKENDPQTFPEPESQDFKLDKELFEFKEPQIPEDKQLDSLQLKNYKKLYIPGEQEAHQRFLDYVKSSEVKRYDENRNQLDVDVGSHISHYLSIGSICSRSIIRGVIDNKVLKEIDSGNGSVLQWVRQVAWRDFYKHIVANWPHVCMFKPYHLDYSDLQWEYNKDHFDAWIEGNTGYPIVDAVMRELHQTGFISNRGRMIVASFLSKHLMIDWRWGEKYFMDILIDGDFASNNGGWGFSSSTGVDPQPYFRIFNPYLQAERFDSAGEYTRKWVPELEEVKGKQIYHPYEKNNEPINGYPEPIVEHKFARQRALDRFRENK